MFPNVSARFICTGWIISATGVFPVSFGGDTEFLHTTAKYHRIDITVEIDHMSGNEISRMIDKIIFQYGRIPENAKNAALQISNRMRIHWIPGSALRCGPSPRLVGRMKQRS